MATRLYLFGSPEIHVDGEAFALPCERRAQLLVFLAQKRAWVNRAEVAALFWPEQATKLAYANLRKTLFRLQLLPWAPAVATQANLLRCDTATDTAAFEQARREERFDDALVHCRGDFLAGFDDDSSEAWASWLAFERERLRGAFRTAVLQRLDAAIEPAAAAATVGATARAGPARRAGAAGACRGAGGRRPGSAGAARLPRLRAAAGR